MNSFQAQFNSLLGLALGAKKLLGTPEIPNPVPAAPEKPKQQEYKPVESGFSPLETLAVSDEGRAAVIARERSLQNLRNRHNALRTIKQANKGELTWR